MATTIYARTEEIAVLDALYNSNKSEFLAIYGRRRVGKTFLIKEFFKIKKKTIFLKITGLNKGLMREQIENFITEMSELFYGGASLAIPKNWQQTFAMLNQAIKASPTDKKIILFFDELPWMATRNSRLLEGLEYYWNHHWSDNAQIKLIVCGSSSSWIVKKIINNKGGFHNRITRKIHLSPLSLKETKEFLQLSGIKLNNSQILLLYMAIGGIPYYLTYVEKGLSTTQIIENLAFRKNSFLLEEFDNLFASLFDQAEEYINVLKIISKKQSGIAQEELLNKLDKSLQGKRGLEILNELEQADFIMGFKPHFHKRRGIYYRLIDEYTLFYLRWIQPIKKILQEHSLEKGHWQAIQNSPEWHAWSGYAFEALCYKHIPQIRQRLNVPLGSIADTWRYVPKKKETNQGAQIDLLFDRKDNAITLCEIKYSNKPYTLTKDYVSLLLQKSSALKKQTGTTKQLFWTLISANGIHHNFYTEDILNGVVTLDDFFT